MARLCFIKSFRSICKVLKLGDLIILEEMHSSTDFVSIFFILCKDRQMPTVSAHENTEAAIRPVHPTA